MQVFNRIATLLVAIENCEKHGNAEWLDKHKAALDELTDSAPSGSGLDNGVAFVVHESSEMKLVFSTSFHHMDEHGSYDGWTDHRIVVTPTMLPPGIDVRVTGRNRNEIKDYLGEIFYSWLTSEVTES